MVKIIDVTENREESRKRINLLETLAKQTISDCEIQVFGDLYLRIKVNRYSEPIVVYPQTRKITVKHPELAPDAVGLARAYEGAGEQEFTVETDFSKF